MTASMFRAPGLALAVFVLMITGLTACKPEPPPTDEPPEPKAATADATELRDAIKQPIDRAKAVEAATREATEKQRAEIDAATN